MENTKKSCKENDKDEKRRKSKNTISWKKELRLFIIDKIVYFILKLKIFYFILLKILKLYVPIFEKIAPRAEIREEKHKGTQKNIVRSARQNQSETI